MSHGLFDWKKINARQQQPQKTGQEKEIKFIQNAIGVLQGPSDYLQTVKNALRASEWFMEFTGITDCSREELLTFLHEKLQRLQG
jgi:hypothetical protein